MPDASHGKRGLDALVGVEEPAPQHLCDVVGIHTRWPFLDLSHLVHAWIDGEARDKRVQVLERVSGRN